MLFESLEVRNYPKKANKTKDNKQFKILYLVVMGTCGIHTGSE